MGLDLFAMLENKVPFAENRCWYIIHSLDSWKGVLIFITWYARHNRHTSSIFHMNKGNFTSFPCFPMHHTLSNPTVVRIGLEVLAEQVTRQIGI